MATRYDYTDEDRRELLSQVLRFLSQGHSMNAACYAVDINAHTALSWADRLQIVLKPEEQLQAKVDRVLLYSSREQITDLVNDLKTSTVPVNGPLTKVKTATEITTEMLEEDTPISKRRAQRHEGFPENCRVRTDLVKSPAPVVKARVTYPNRSKNRRRTNRWKYEIWQRIHG